MTLVVTIGGTDRTHYVDWTSLNIQSILTNQVDTATLSLRRYVTQTFKPVAGQEIIITANGTKIFGGVIVRVTESALAYSPVTPLLQYDLECTDYGRILDSHLVVASYTGQTVNAIIADLVANWFDPGVFTTANVNCAVVVSFIQFNYIPGAECLTRLAQMVGYDWYVDYDKDINFFLPIPTTAPVDIADDTGTYEYQSLIIRDDNSQVRNTVYVRGGTYLGSQFTAQVLANGTDSIYPLGYQYEDFSVTLTGQRLTIGVDGLDDPNSFDVMHNNEQALIKFRTSRIPTASSVMRIGGKPYLPVRIKYKNQALVNAMAATEGIGDGVYEYLIVNQSLNSREGAHQRAVQEIQTYGSTLIEGEFLTETDGFVPGQQVRINSASRVIDAYYIVSQVITTAITPTRLRYDIKLITTKTFGFIEMLRRLLLEGADNITTSASEILDLSESADETLAMAETLSYAIGGNSQTETVTMTETKFTAQSLGYRVEFVAGNFGAPSGHKRQAFASQSYAGQIIL